MGLCSNFSWATDLEQSALESRYQTDSTSDLLDTRLDSEVMNLTLDSLVHGRSPGVRWRAVQRF